MARLLSFATSCAAVQWMLLLGNVHAQSTTSSASATGTASATTACPTVLRPSYNSPVVAGGYVAQLVVTGLSTPRSILLDDAGALLVVQSGTGIQRITFDDHGGTCLIVSDSQTLVDFSDLNHGIALSADGKTLYASSSNTVYSWAYDSSAGTVGSERSQLVTNMTNSDHSTRTLLVSQSSPANTTMLLVSRGSAENMDMETTEISSGRSQIKAFDISNTSEMPYDYTSGGTLVGWGLRNSVGIAEHPTTGALYSVENSADQIQRQGQDIHEDDPGEELNFHGLINDTTSPSYYMGENYGYPSCFAVWSADLPNAGNLTVGSQFSLNPNTTLNDTSCAQDYVPPRLTFQAHTAPLDIVFTPDGSEAYISFHGSWNRDDPAGYKLSVVPFANGEPTDATNSTSAAKSVLSNGDISSCPDSCFRPVGIAVDAQGRIFMSSDSTGEVYVLRKAEMTALGGGSTASSSGTLVTSTSSSQANIAIRSARGRPTDGQIWLAYVALALSFVGGLMVIAA